MYVAVLDVGKTNVKAVVVDTATGRELAARTRPNRVLTEGPYPHFDVEGIFAFFIEALRELYATLGFAAISLTAHGACGALLSDEGLALPVLDYEHRYPADIDAAYDAIRPPFAETFSPRLPGGLNLGAQFHYLKSAFPQAFAKVRSIVTWPQYWGWRLTGVAACDVTSLGCHTDLWRPHEGRLSSLVERLGMAGRLAPVRRPSDVLGPVAADIARQIGLDRPVPVHCGIHDSNASLLPHLDREPPFAVVSTGTWVVTFAVGGNLARLDPARDTLANVDAFGRAVPSARFMGGREFEILTGGSGQGTSAALARVIGEPILVMPGVVPDCGPFPRTDGRPTASLQGLDADEAHVAASLYTAMMTKTCLDLTGAAGPVIVEGPFARNRLFCEALAEAAGRPVMPMAGATGTSVGAALLATGAPTTPPVPEAVVAPGSLPAGFASYRAEWEQAAQAR